MKISLSDAKKLSNTILLSFGFSEEESDYITKNLIDAEKAGRKSHGLSKLPVIKKVLANPYDEGKKYFKYINLHKDEDLEDISSSANHLYVDAHYRSGYYAISKTLERALPLARKTCVFAVGIKNIGFSSGYIGAYADKAANEGLIFIGFHSSSGGLNYFGSKEDPLGTNPVTIGAPSDEYNTITDTSMAALNWSDIEVAKQENKKLPEGVAIDEGGKDTMIPSDVFAVKSIAGHKGTALAYSVELLAGALTGSRVGFSQQGGWGSFFTLVNPDYFVGMDRFKDSVTESNISIKNLPALSETYVPGEQSALSRKNINELGFFEISDMLSSELEGLVSSSRK